MKNSAIKISSAILAFILLMAVGLILLAPMGVASADSTVEVIKAPVSNLEGNATAGKSTLKISTIDKEIYIPESYFLQYQGVYAGDMHKVTYAGETFYFKGEPVLSKITVAENEILSPNVTLTIKEGETVTIGNFIITNDFLIKLLGFNADGTELYVSISLNGDKLPNTFISAAYFNPFTIPYQQKTQTERDELLASKVEPPIIDGGNFKPNTSVGLRIVIIIGIAIPAILIVILLFKPSKHERKYSKNSVRSGRGRDEFDYDDSRSYRRRERDDRNECDDRDYNRRDYRDDRDYDRRDDRDYR